jgi:pimeloyl-ACP methyl ester carboxylesterase
MCSDRPVERRTRLSVVVAAWDRWYKFLTQQHGISKKPTFIGMSKGGVNEFNWGVAHPDKVACIYADNPALYDEGFARLSAHDVPCCTSAAPRIFCCNGIPWLSRTSTHQLGGSITVLIKEGTAHHPHSLKNPKLITRAIPRCTVSRRSRLLLITWLRWRQLVS